VMRLIINTLAGTVTYELASASWNCNGSNVMAYVSQSNLPNSMSPYCTYPTSSITVTATDSSVCPRHYYCGQCQLPDIVHVTFSADTSGTCYDFGGKTYPLDLTTFGLGPAWESGNQSCALTPEGGFLVRLLCGTPDPHDPLASYELITTGGTPEFGQFCDWTTTSIQCDPLVLTFTNTLTSDCPDTTCPFCTSDHTIIATVTE
jgi:hypothetical protein